MPEEEHQFKFNMKGALLAIFWIAVCLTTIANADFFLESASPANWRLIAFFFVAVIVPPAAAVGAICGHPYIGLCCGGASTWALLIFTYFAD